MAQAYAHEPLPSSRSIRLISLAPSVTPNAPIRCDITIVELQSQRAKVPYEALSYVWGSPTGTIPIRCKGMELLVTPNCYDALRRLRSRFSRRTLWIDAICIDQGDDDRAIRERNSQVQMMGDIYENAARVLIWLGPAHKFTPAVFRLLSMIGFIASWSWRHNFAQFSEKLIVKTLSRRFQVWIRAMANLQCSVPQDKVYGLYSIFRAAGLELPDVDYKKTVQEVYGDTAKSFIRMRSRKLNVLLISIKPRGYDELPSWTPNWEMSQMLGPDVVDITGNFHLESDRYRASGYSLATIPNFTPARELQVRGLIVGTVQKIIVSSTAGEQPELVGKRNFSVNYVIACRAWLMQLGSIWEADMYQGQEVPANAMINTLAFFKMSEAESLELEQTEAQFRSWADVFAYPDCNVVTAQDIEAVAQLDPSSVDYSEIIEAALNHANIRSSGDTVSDAVKQILVSAGIFHFVICFQLANWAFLFLETGHIGRAYYNCREGDKVALLAGSNVPFVVREVGRDRYQLVAPAYIHGIMYGESWPVDENGVKDMTLV
ncbi:hypothetical protein GL218_08486 [Daldinia childiae]|uniref:uncharacterized protein n=1 Tax=Daldinia childiae TaxID=326645 RepID=UPI001444A404|nr:uncharacterized protein GL218_08486 [Daldinia childiae]KAF3067226.1 hypothetical protein GL218_08486 [Daldinia childiae]